MSVQVFPNTKDGHSSAASVAAAKKHIWVDGKRIVVYTDADADAQAVARPKDEVDADAARGYAKLKALMGMTPAEVQTWVDGNVKDLATATDAIKTLAVAVSILARKLL
jgi:hypothetical protein